MSKKKDEKVIIIPNIIVLLIVVVGFSLMCLEGAGVDVSAELVNFILRLKK
jgi:hypothetical protein